MAQPHFLVEINCSNLVPQAIALVQRLVSELDAIDCQMVESIERLKVAKVDEVEMRGRSRDEPTEHDRLEEVYLARATRLAEVLGVPINPLSTRFAGAGGSIPVALEF